MPKSLSTLEIRTKLADLGLVGFARGAVVWEGDHVRLILLPKDSKGLSKEVVAKISTYLRRIGCRCMLDENERALEAVRVDISCVNRVAQLADECESVDDGEQSSVVSGGEGGDLPVVKQSLRAGKACRKLKVATWNFSGLCSERKQKEVAEILSRLTIDIVAGQESWEREGKNIVVDGYKWFGKPRKDQSNPRGEGGVGFLVRECLVDEVEFVSTVKYEESVWMKVRGGREREALYICCVYMPMDSSSVSVIRESYASLKEDVLGFKQKGRVVLLGDFNARVGRSMDVDDVIGMFGEDTWNASSNKFFNEMELVICNGRQLVLEPEWTRVRPSLDQKSVIDFIVTDVQLMRESGEVIVDSTDIGVSDHFLVWLELGRVAKCCRKQKRTIRKWRLDRFVEDGVKGKYCQALRAEVESFSESIREKVVQGTRGRELVSEVLEDWESIVNRVAKAEVGEKVVVCGRAARWWEDEIKAKIEQRREFYKRILRGEDELWEEYVRLRKEVISYRKEASDSE